METALQLADKIKRKAFSSEELIQDTIRKIEAVNGDLNAITATRFEKALHEARTRDFSNALFGGVPIFLKDLGQQLKGEKNTSGSRLLQHFVSTQTDYIVDAFQRLGFVVIGQTTAPEFGFKNYTQSQLYGTTRNPLDVNRHAGGSSGGAASVVASGIVPIAGASDGGGSIRIPASWTGLVGLKPSRGRIPVGPGSYRGWQGAAVHFALTKSLQDTKALFYGMQTEQWESPFTLPLNNPISQKKPLKIAYTVKSPVHTPVSQEAKNAVLQTVTRLVELGCDVVEIEPELDGVALMESYYTMNNVETAAMFLKMEKQMGRALTRDDMEDMTWLIYQAGKNIPATAYSMVLAQWDEANAVMTQFHQTYDILLSPTTADVAPLVETYGVLPQVTDWADRILDMSQPEKEKVVWDMFIHGLTLSPFTQQANLTGQPSISLPVYQTQAGLPIGVQATARKGREDLLFTVAELLEIA